VGRGIAVNTVASNTASSMFDRMFNPFLNPDSYDLLLDPDMKDVLAVSELLALDARQVRCYPVSSRING